MDETSGEKALRLLDRLCDAMQRKGTEQDGNWGWPSFAEDVRQIRAEIAESEPNPSPIGEEG